MQEIIDTLFVSTICDKLVFEDSPVFLGIISKEAKETTESKYGDRGLILTLISTHEDISFRLKRTGMRKYVSTFKVESPTLDGFPIHTNKLDQEPPQVVLVDWKDYKGKEIDHV